MDNTDLFKQLGLNSLSKKHKVELTKELSEVVLARVATRIEGMLSNEQIKIMSKAMESNKNGGADLIYQYIPNFDEIIQEEANLVRQETLKMHAQVMKEFDF